MYKPLYILFLLLIIGTSSNAQNLVYNGDFEIFDTCPNTSSQLNLCTGWNAPTDGTSDYFNSCSSFSSTVSVPNNFAGFQQPYSGNGYAGFFPFWDAFPCEYREYIQTKLTQPMKVGVKYKIEFYVSLSFPQAAVEKIGALFTTNQVNRVDFCPIFASPQVVNQNGFLTDSLGWTKIEGDFIANGSEEYLTIGYFEDTINSSDLVLPILPDSITLGFFNPYYYIDGIEITEIEAEIIIPNIITPNGDNLNDLFQLNFPVIKTEIYNRWGQQLFNSSNDAFWDGRTTSGSEVPEGTYYYIIVTKEKTYKGYLQLLRGSYTNNYK